MKSSAINILDFLMKGSHSITGKIFENDHVCNEPMVIWTLASAVIALRQAGDMKFTSGQLSKSCTNQNNRLNAGRPWTTNDDLQLPIYSCRIHL